MSPSANEILSGGGEHEVTFPEGALPKSCSKRTSGLLYRTQNGEVRVATFVDERKGHVHARVKDADADVFTKK